MKTLKKILSLVLVAAVLIPSSILLTGCTQGKYTVESMTGGGETTTKAQFMEKYGDDFDYENAESIEQAFAESLAQIFGMEINLKSRGVAEITINLPKWFPEDKKADIKVNNATWEKKDNQIIVKEDGEEFLTFKIEDKKLVLEDETLKVVFSK